MPKNYDSLAKDMMEDLTTKFMRNASRIKQEEFNLYYKYYLELAEEIKKIDKVKIDVDTPEDIKIGGSELSDKDFEPALWMEIQYLAVKWKAHPMAMAFALILLPRYIETMIEILTNTEGSQERINKDVEFVKAIYEVQKERNDNNDWDYI